MKYCHRRYLTKLSGIMGEEDKMEINFSDNELKNEFNKFKLKKQLSNSNSLTIFLCLPSILIICSNLYINKIPIRPTYFFIAGIIIDLILSRVSIKLQNNYLSFNYFRILRFFIIYFNMTINWIFPVNPVEENLLRYAYCFIFYINFLQNYYIDFNYFLFIFITISNTIVLFCVQINRNLDYLHTFPEILVNIFYYYIFNLYKKLELTSEKNSFFESYRNKNYIEYIKNLVNVLNTLIISVKNDDVLFINDYAINYFSNHGLLTNQYSINSPVSDERDNLFPNENKKNIEINEMITNFFTSLKLKNTYFNIFKNGENFKNICKEISSNDTFNSVNFIKLGYFTCLNDKDLFFEIHVRKLKHREEALEILIYDISEIKIAEKKAIETKYKHKILAKIAHEFKTPLITIISLINNIIQDQDNTITDFKTKKNLYYINNLSNYTLSLISDIIQYVSDYVNLRIVKNEINLNEIMDFSNNVLKTLVECNESKSNKIQTKMVLDKRIENIKIFTDENRLKQILLNLISNAFKFTKQGLIKLKAKYIIASNLVEISVKDTGSGIKDEEHNLIFKENIQLNVDNEYNRQGSGLGLSIVKNMSDLLNYKIGFKSTFGKGSKFYIRINCFNSQFLSRSKSISFKSNFHLFDNILNPNTQTSLGNKNKFKSNKNVLDGLYYLETNKEIQKKLNQTDLNETEVIKNDLVKYRDSIQMIKIETEQNEITGFNFTLQITKQDSFKTMKLVIVDDHKLVRDYTINLIKCLLKDINSTLYEIVECSDGIELLNAIKLDSWNQIKLILTDENMEYLNGSDSVKIIRKLQENKKINNYHIVSLTAFDDYETKENLMSSGVNSVITKPCNKSDLSKILNNFFIPFIK